MEIYNEYKNQKEGLLFLAIVDEMGVLRMLKITPKSYRMSLPGYQSSPRSGEEVLVSKIMPIVDNKRRVTYFAAIDSYADKTEISLFDIYTYERIQSYVYADKIKDFSGYSFSKKYSMAILTLESENIEKIIAVHIVNK
mmetsp:Transcript_27297/g.24178  ORF Transcript_27297/g.24178 Transcript_27297/m.24178 type:complete len:139 (+) Transcript_27297:653-1069(+)